MSESELLDDVEVKVLFIEANDEVLIKRYKETRRKHPLDEKFNGNMHEAIRYERNRLSQLREIADYYIETSLYSSARLKEQVKSIFLENSSDSLITEPDIPVTINSSILSLLKVKTNDYSNTTGSSSRI